MQQYIEANWQDLLTASGLTLTFAGAALTVKPMFVSKNQAAEQSYARFGSSNILRQATSPLAIILLRGAKQGRWGLSLIALGSFVQIIPILARLTC